MARRSYLQRIAEPLPPGQPVLFAVPRPAADAVRPAAAPKTRAAPAPRLKPATTESPQPAAPTPSTSATAGAPPFRSAEAPHVAPDAPGSGSVTTETLPMQTSPAETHPADSSPGPELLVSAEFPIVGATDPIPGQLPTHAAPPPNIARSWPSRSAGGAPPRVHIGTIEVRTSQPPAPAPPPPSGPARQPASTASPAFGATPYSRAYGWRFGLSQS